MENKVCDYCLLCVFKGLVCNQCLGSPLSECLDCTQIVIRQGLVAWPLGQPEARGPHLLLTPAIHAHPSTEGGNPAWVSWWLPLGMFQTWKTNREKLTQKQGDAGNK